MGGKTLNKDGVKIKDPPGGIKSDWIPILPDLFEYPPSEGQIPALLANQCTKCGKSFFPKRAICPYCFVEGTLEDITLDKRGVIYACTVVHIPSPVGIEAPYAYGYVEIPANGLRVPAVFSGSDPFSFAPGQEVELVLEPIRVNRDGQQIIGYKFRAVD